MSAAELFESAFGGVPDAVGSAPGRVNLIGEHTDYNGGFVLPLAIAQRTQVAIRLRTDAQFHAVSAQREPAAVEQFEVSDSSKEASFVGYLAGAFKALRAAGQHVTGADIAVASDVPIGSGLASSAALLVSTLRACEAALGVSLGQPSLAEMAYRAEHDYVGVPVGRMDPTACALATTASALFLNTRSMQHETVAIPDSLELVVVDSGVRHVHGTGEYRTRRAQCEQAAEQLGVRFLCDLDDTSDLELSLGWTSLSAELRKRARHVVKENKRVIRAMSALQARDGAMLGALLNESHASLRDDFEVSTVEVDALVAAVREQPGCLGARMTGGGFGGAIVALTHAGLAERAATRALEAYHQRVPGARGRVIVPTPERGSAP